MEHQALDNQHRHHDQSRRPRPQKDRRQHRPHEMPRGPPCHREIDHLRGEDERGQHAQKRNLLFPHDPPGPGDRQRRHAYGNRIERRPGLRLQKSIRYVHTIRNRSAPRYSPVRATAPP
jgi:hypothetical protein